MKEALSLVLQVFVVYRVARLIAVDNGPFDLFQNFRLFCGRLAARGRVFKTLADGVNCQYCVGFWVSLVMALVLPGEYLWWVHWLSVAGIHAFLVDLVYKSDGSF